MVKLFLLLFCLIAQISCSRKSVPVQPANVKNYELQYNNLIDGISTISGFDSSVLYESNKIGIEEIKELSQYSEINIDELIKFELISGTKNMETALNSKHDIEKNFIKTTKAYYLGSITKSSILILTVDEDQYVSNHSIFLLNQNGGKVRSVARVAYLLDFEEHVSKASTKILGNNRFEYREEEVVSDVVVIGVEEEKNIPVNFEFDEEGLIQINR